MSVIEGLPPPIKTIDCDDPWCVFEPGTVVSYCLECSRANFLLTSHPPNHWKKLIDRWTNLRSHPGPKRYPHGMRSI